MGSTVEGGAFGRVSTWVHTRDDRCNQGTDSNIIIVYISSSEQKYSNTRGGRNKEKATLATMSDRDLKQTVAGWDFCQKYLFFFSVFLKLGFSIPRV